MEKKNIPLIIIILALAGALYYFQVGRKTGKVGNDITAVEIQNFEGKDLSSINDFRENSIKGPQYIDENSYRLKITGLKSGDKEISYPEIVGAFPPQKKAVTLNCVEGWSVTILWEGFFFKDLVPRENIPADKKVVIFRAVDGYLTSFPVDYLYNNNIMIADKMNGVKLPPERGFPFQLVAESKYGYKWIKWITEIEFSSDENYRGYWESRGYSNSGDLKENFIGK